LSTESGMSWSYHNPVRVIFGVGARSRVTDAVALQALLVTSPGFVARGVAQEISDLLGARLIGVVANAKPNPDVADVDAMAHQLRGESPELLIALGGGSSIDTAKGLARLLVQPAGFRLTAHFRDGVPLEQVPALPIVAMPTTAGTGAEVTPFGTLWDFARQRKHSIVGDDLYPKTAILDPQLTLGLPEDVTIASGLDAISHAFESTWNRHASAITLGFAMKSLQLSLEALLELKARPANLDARSKMMQASLLSGFAISQTRTALAHSISYPLTTHFGVPHGLACSFTLPALMRFNAGADDGRLGVLAGTLGYRSTAGLSDALEGLFEQLDVGTRLARYVPGRRELMALVDQMFSPGRAENNLRAASISDAERIVNESLDAIAFPRT
jgi:alcohol dehydrogenase